MKTLFKIKIAQCFFFVLAYVNSVRAYGSAALNLSHVAAGRGDAYVEYGIHIWDFLAGALIASEAGAVVLDPTGKTTFCNPNKNAPVILTYYKQLKETLYLLSICIPDKFFLKIRC